MKEVLGLGISGAELILRQLNKIKKAKDDFKKPAAFKASAAVSAFKKLTGQKDNQEPSEQREPSKKETDKSPKTKEFDRSKEVGGATREAGQAIGGIKGVDLAQAAIKGTAALGGPVGMLVGQIANDIIDAATTFRDKVKQAAQIHADTLETQNTAIRYAGKGFEDYIKSSREDINRATQKAIVSGLGAQYGKLTNEFRDQLEKLFGQKIGGKRTDLGETTELAQGNFAALGTDRGFFMQKIADSFSNLPPTIKQKLMGQLLESVPESERATQGNELTNLKGTLTRLDDSTRNSQREFSSAENLRLAENVQKLTDLLDTKLSKGITTLIQKIEGLAKAESAKDYLITELKSAVLDLKSVIFGGGKPAF
jgi:hypothetical protein